MSEGSAVVLYNEGKILESVYKCISESKAGLEKDTVHAELRNQFMPIAADYLHKFEYGATEDDDTVVSIFDTKSKNLLLKIEFVKQVKNQEVEESTSTSSIFLEKVGVRLNLMITGFII